METHSRPSCVCKELSLTSIGKYDYTGYLITKLSNLSKSLCGLPQISIYRRIFKNKKRS